MTTTAEEAEFDAAARAQRHAAKLDPGPLRAADALSSVDGSMTDALLAERVAGQLLGNEFVWSAGLGWMRWDGMRWERCDEVVVIETVREYMTRLVVPEMALAAEDWRRRGALAALLSKGRISAVTSLTRGQLAVKSEEFDAHPDLLNTPSGVVDLRTGKLAPHDPALLLTKITSVPYVPGATHPDWTKALQAIPQECHSYFQMRVGQSVTGYMTPDDVLLILQGGGENGKTTIFESITRGLGDYQVLVSKKALLANPNEHSTELMDFRGARLAVAEELPEGHRLQVDRLKDIIGTPRMTARYIRQDTVTWDVTHTMLISTNYLPIVEETDHGTWRRLLLQEFPYRFLKPHDKGTGAPNERPGDATLRDRMKRDPQRIAVLAWVIEGARRWYQAERIFPEPPKRIRDSTLAWRKLSDSILAYWGERLVPDEGSHVVSTDVLKDFSIWLRQRGQREWSDRLFSPRFLDHEETKRHRVVSKRVRKGDQGLSRPRLDDRWDALPDLPNQYTAYLGVQFGEPVEELES